MTTAVPEHTRKAKPDEQPTDGARAEIRKVASVTAVPVPGLVTADRDLATNQAATTNIGLLRGRSDIGSGPGREAHPATAVIRRVTVTDEETGAELPELTIQDLLGALPARVSRRLAALPAPMLRDLAALPPNAQQAMLLLPADTQLLIIEALHGLAAGGGQQGGGYQQAGGGQQGAPGQGAIIAMPGAAPAPGGPTALPPDFIDVLLGRSTATWSGNIRINVPPPGPNGHPMLPWHPPGLPPSLGPLTVHLPTASPADLRPPDLSPEGRQERREAYGEQLLTGYERPRPSGTKLPVPAAVAQVGAQHPATAARREEAARDEEWSTASGAAYGQRAAQAKNAGYTQDLADKRQAVTTTTPARKIKKEKDKPQAMKNAEAALKVLEDAPPDLPAVAATAGATWIAALTALRSAGMSRAAIDTLVGVIGAEELHTALAANSPVVIARLARHLTPAQIGGLLLAGNGKVPPALTDQVAAVLSALFAAGASPPLVIAAVRALGDQLPVLMAQPAAACAKLLRVGDLPLLKTMIAGGQAINLTTLAPLLDIPVLTTVLDCAKTAVTMGQLFTAGAGPLSTLFQANVPRPTLQMWCTGPILASTVLLLGRADLPACLPALPLLASDGAGPTQLMATLLAGANAARVRDGVADAKALLKNPSDALNFFRTNPLATLLEFHQSVAAAAAAAASLPAVNPRTAYARSGKPYTKMDDKAKLDCATLHMLLDEGYAQIHYAATFKTTTETFQGGDTEEYDIWTHNGADWQCLWVVHLHRNFGQSKRDVPVAKHLKFYRQKEQKETTRIDIDSRMADRCRQNHP